MNAKILLGALLSLSLAGCVVPVDSDGHYRRDYDDSYQSQNDNQGQRHHNRHHHQNQDSTAATGSRVSALEDLVGARAGQAEGELTSRGYSFIRKEAAGSSAYAYYNEEQTGNCVTVRTQDGRFASIVYATQFDCR